MRRRSSRIAGDPMLIGAVALFIAVVGVYFAYQADSGLPLVPTYDVRAVLPDAQNVARNAEVRMAGVRVGRVGGREVRMLADGRTQAILELELDKSIDPLPTGTSMRMRATSTLGGNYVEVLPGSGSRPLRGSHPTIYGGPRSAPPSLSDALQAYDEPTRRGVNRTLSGYGDALVGRGSDLNGFFAEAPKLLRRLDGAGRILASERTGLAPFIDGFARLSAGVVPVAEQQAGLFVGLDNTLGALASVRDSVAESTARAPASLQAGIEGFPRQRPLLRESAALFAAIAPGVHSASGAADDIEAAAVAGPPAMKALDRVAPNLSSTGTAVERFSKDPAVVPGLQSLLSTFKALDPTVADLRTSQVVCNYPGLLVRNLLSVASDGDSVGNWLSSFTIFHLPGPNLEPGPSALPANGPTDVDKLHSDPYPYTGKGPDGSECEAGNEGYAPGQVIGHPSGRQQAATEKTAVKGDGK